MKSQALLDHFFYFEFCVPNLGCSSTVQVSLTDDGLALVLTHGPGPQWTVGPTQDYSRKYDQYKLTNMLNNNTQR